MSVVPVIELAPLRRGDASEVAAAIEAACRDMGFFCVTGHGIDPALFRSLDAAARQFFALDDGAKRQVAMSAGGRAWRGWFPLAGEMTNGVPDRKEGYYFGQELGDDHPAVVAGVPLHGRNLFPPEVPALRDTVLHWLDELTTLAHTVMQGVAVGLGLPQDWFRDHLTQDPTVLFRIFRYPPPRLDDGAGEWGVAEHTDYGLLTLLAQDDCGGLQVKSRQGWVDVEPVADSFVCNIGDMLERMTGGRYRSTPHRVRNTSGRERLSFPFFFDPSWAAHVEPLPLEADARAGSASADGSARWDGASVFDFDGTYGEYLVAKVSKVFPDLVHVI
jgi:isopenicillin N synthase-like dioxygenase